MGCANSVDFLLALGSLNRRLAGGQAELVPIECSRLAAVDDTDLLVGAFTVQLVLFVVFDPAVALRHVRCRYLGQRVLGLARRPQLLVVALDGLESIYLLADRGESRSFGLAVRDVDHDWLLLVEALPRL